MVSRTEKHQNLSHAIRKGGHRSDRFFTQGYLMSKLKTGEIEQIVCGEQRILIGILNKFLTENIEIKKKSMLGFFVLETKADIKIKQETQTKEKQTSWKISKKNTKGRLSKQV